MYISSKYKEHPKEKYQILINLLGYLVWVVSKHHFINFKKLYFNWHKSVADTAKVPEHCP
jgi:hypothetical protein